MNDMSGCLWEDAGPGSRSSWAPSSVAAPAAEGGGPHSKAIRQALASPARHIRHEARLLEFCLAGIYGLHPALRNSSR